uniref:Protein kinase domain-containing protein n=1 Tax=Glossina brevipalpis TaxID=37001 RepID=A0A1A9W2Z8_9MUSC
MIFPSKGAFAKVYEIVDIATKEMDAGKIISKKLLTKDNQKEKKTKEKAIHSSRSHLNIVKFHGFFEDDYNIYIVLELRKKNSMMELHKRHDSLHVKIGVFGLATSTEYGGERKETMSSTTNYAAPEIITGKGQLYKVPNQRNHILEVNGVPVESSSLTNNLHDAITTTSAH